MGASLVGLEGDKLDRGNEVMSQGHVNGEIPQRGKGCLEKLVLSDTILITAGQNIVFLNNITQNNRLSILQLKNSLNQQLLFAYRST
jgi:hypothetical protein